MSFFFLIWEQRFGIASIVQLGKLRLATHSNIRLRTNIPKSLNKKRTTYIITNYIYIIIYTYYYFFFNLRVVPIGIGIVAPIGICFYVYMCLFSSFFFLLFLCLPTAAGRDHNGNKIITQLMRYLYSVIPVISFWRFFFIYVRV